LSDLATADGKPDDKTGEPGSLIMQTGELAENDLFIKYNKSKPDELKGNMKVNEMIVYDEAQTRLKFLVEVKFDYES
jgi:hypothetical protein